VIAQAASSVPAGHLLLIVALVLVAGQTGGWACAKAGQPRVIGQIVAGILLGPSLLGAVAPDAFRYLFPVETMAAVRGLSELGVVLFMFWAGLELKLEALRGNGRRALVISHVSIVVPGIFGAALSVWLRPRFEPSVKPLAFALFLSAAMAVTAFPVLVRLLQDLYMDGTPLGVLAITCAAIDDITAWCLLAVVVAVTTAGGVADVAATLAGTGALVSGFVLVVRPTLARFGSVPTGLAVTVGLLAAWAAEQAGVHVVFGAFLAGACMPRSDGQSDALAGRLHDVVTTTLLPMFFVSMGLRVRIDLLSSPYLWAVAGIVIAVAVLGKGGGCTIAARAMGESWRDALTLGALMNTRGLTELVILNIGLDLGVISTTLFTIMVLMAVTTTVMASPLLSLLGRTRSSDGAEAPLHDRLHPAPSRTPLITQRDRGACEIRPAIAAGLPTREEVSGDHPRT
jgi:Kef-type K+ transport system membrane component KefB